VTTPGAVYTGPALDQQLGLPPLLLAANSAGAGSIDVFRNNFAPVSFGAGAFASPASISALGLVPFVQVRNGNVYVTYAPAGRMAQQNAALGAGAVAIFNLDGSSKPNTAFIVGSCLAAPWGLAIAPAAVGPFAGDLLVGNFSFVNSGINIFDPATGAWDGTTYALQITAGVPSTAVRKRGGLSSTKLRLVLDLIDAQLTGRPSLLDLAALLDVSTRYFCQAF
jgi:uncharacterized protein (TIGR03118 family)